MSPGDRVICIEDYWEPPFTVIKSGTRGVVVGHRTMGDPEIAWADGRTTHTPTRFLKRV